MNVSTITMDPRIARIHYADYRKRCRANREKRAAELERIELETHKRTRAQLSQLEREDEELLKAYRALYRGQQILDLPKTIAGAGLDDRKLPRLAICRADKAECHFWTENGIVMMHHEQIWSTWRLDGQVFRFRSGLSAELTDTEWRKRNSHPLRAKAIVPTIPPHLRPDDLKKYFILWEAEWTARAPVDPLLLSRVNGTMFAVVAQWDLTPLEQRVLEGRL